MDRTRLSTPDAAVLLAELRPKYVWWKPVGDVPHAPERIVAQIMNLGTYDDIRRLERTVGFEPLADIMDIAQPGWFSPRSWEFWRGRLTYELGRAIPEEAPRRAFLDVPEP